MAEELADDDVVEMADLTTAQTGVPVPTVVANSLPVRVVRQLSPQVIDWVSRDKDVPLDFWYHGDAWRQPEVNDFIQKLQRV